VQCIIEYAGLHLFRIMQFLFGKRVQFSKKIVTHMWSVSMMQCSDKLGLSLELGSFAAGVMISTTDLAQHTLEQVILHLNLAQFIFFKHERELES
jgi:Kef-type K+ transport system membrane component KefB